MRTLKLFFVLIPLVALISCEKQDDRLSVEKFVRLLKTNKYENTKIPAFTYTDIDKLLEYRDAKNIIRKYPRNDLSSAFHVETELGIYILWAIEAIRIRTITGYAEMFPSLEPLLIPRNQEDFELGYDPLVHQQEAHQKASNAYYTWWTENKVKNLTDVMGIDPLENTKYKWY